MIDAAGVWAELAGSVESQVGLARRRLLPQSTRDIFLAVAHPSGERMLILAVDSDALKPELKLPSTRGISTTVIPLETGRAEVRVALTSNDILRVFASFVEDVATVAGEADDDEQALGALASRFDHWRRLLAGAPKGGLGRDAAQGLWAELWVMRHVLLPKWGASAVDAWTGCQRDEKDYRRGELAVEVKSTRADAPHAIRINGEHQLEDAGPGVDLLLVVLEIDVHDGGAGQTLNAVVDETRATASTFPSPLDEKLAEYGYFDEDRAHYEDTRYTVREVLWFRVTSGFPRITSDQLPDGLGRVSYFISTDACLPWRVEDAAVEEVLSKGERFA